MTDRWLIGAAIALVGLGAVSVYSASGINSEESLLLSHLLAIGAGIVAFAIATRIPLAWLRAASVPLLVAAIALLALTALTPLGFSAGGATRWLRAGALQVQPSEIAKIALVVYLAHILAKKRERIREFLTGFLPPVCISAIAVVLLLRQPDFGNAALVALLLALLLFVAGTRLNYLFLSLLAVAPVVYALITQSPYRALRVKAFLDPWAHRHEEGYQVFQSLISFAAGGATGVGMGAGHQKLGYVPELHNDFILANIGEELGFAGVVATLLCFAIIVWRGFRAARRAEDRFALFVAFGSTAMIGLGAIVNAGVALGVLPTKGLPLPFVSHGGTSMVVSFFALGLVAQVARVGEGTVARTSRAGWGAEAGTGTDAVAGAGAGAGAGVAAWREGQA